MHDTCLTAAPREQKMTVSGSAKLCNGSPRWLGNNDFADVHPARTLGGNA